MTSFSSTYYVECNCSHGYAFMGGWYCPIHGWKNNPILEEKMKSAFEDQEGGSHYKTFAIQPLEFISKNSLSWFVGNIVKYACRHDKKGGAKDLKKVIHYARLCLEQDYKIKSEIKYQINEDDSTPEKLSEEEKSKL